MGKTAGIDKGNKGRTAGIENPRPDDELFLKSVFCFGFVGKDRGLAFLQCQPLTAMSTVHVRFTRDCCHHPPSCPAGLKDFAASLQSTKVSI